MSLQFLLICIFIFTINILILYIFYNLISKKIESNFVKNNNEDIKIKLDLIKEQIKLTTIIIQNNSALISKNKKDLDTFEAFIKSALASVSDEVIH